MAYDAPASSMTYYCILSSTFASFNYYCSL